MSIDEKEPLRPTAPDLKLLGIAVDLASGVQMLATSVRALAEASDLDEDARKALIELVESAQARNSSIFTDINDFIERTKAGRQ